MDQHPPWIVRKFLLTESMRSLRNEPSPSTLEECKLSVVSSRLNNELLDFCTTYGNVWTSTLEQDAARVQDVLPFEDYYHSSNYFSAHHQLSMHQDYYYEDTPPDLTVIFCVKNDEEAVTTISDLRKSFYELSVEHRSELAKKDFSMGSYENPAVFADYAVAEENGKTFRYDEDLVFPLTHSSATAWESFKKTVELNSSEVVLSPGDLLIVDNRRCAHGRSSFLPLNGSSRRWLKRCLVSYIKSQ